MAWMNLFDVYPDAEVTVYSSQEDLEERVEGGRVIIEADDIGSGGGYIEVLINLHGKESRLKVRLTSVEAEAVAGGSEWEISFASCYSNSSEQEESVSPAAGDIEFSGPIPWDSIWVGVDRVGT